MSTLPVVDDLVKDSGVQVHHLPCTIRHTGAAKTSSFFHPKPCSDQAGKARLIFSVRVCIRPAKLTRCADVQQAAFRGRLFYGAPVTLPSEYVGQVCMIEKPEGGKEDAPRLRVTHRFDHFRYWLHDQRPSASDGIRQTVEWTGIADEVH
jgi:ribonuclease H2 subunit C